MRPTAKTIMTMLFDRADEDGRVQISKTEICPVAGVGRKTVEYHMHNFKRRDWLILEQANGLVPVYRLNVDRSDVLGDG